MITTGILRVNDNVSRLNGTRLAIQGASNPFKEATDFLANRDLDDGDFIFVDGTNGAVGNVPVIFITNAGAAAGARVGAGAKGLRGGAKKRAAKKPAKKGRTKKSTKKTTTKRTSTKKSAAKKSGKASRKR